MRIVIEGEAAAIVERLVAAGGFASAQEAVEDALRVASVEAERVSAVRAKVRDALDAGEDGTLDELDREMDIVLGELEQELAGRHDGNRA